MDLRLLSKEKALEIAELAIGFSDFKEEDAEIFFQYLESSDVSEKGDEGIMIVFPSIMLSEDNEFGIVRIFENLDVMAGIYEKEGELEGKPFYHLLKILKIQNQRKIQETFESLGIKAIN